MADITRADALALLARQDLNEIIKPDTQSSAALAAFRTVRMSAGTTRMPVLGPVHENTLADSNFDVWGEVRPLVAQEFGRILDAAVFFGVNKPSTWLDPALVPGAVAAGNYVVEGTGVDLAEDINEAFGTV